MNTGPLKLNIPLERKNYLTHWIIAGCIAFTVAAAFFNVDFAIVFFASSIVGLPMLLIIVLPSKNRPLFSSWGVLGRFAAYMLVFGYIAIAKSILVPALLSVMRHAMA
ncbi:hypothetical protein ACFQDN_13430 [Pseudomonas asuensis]|uniref:Uncharacterized protein n=1 Tax=Pseudomonas asuensis TaxID=1825787 RepID=A0ABQ2H381_9PSED|nr:hypothetical protein [Pseudomonas asuensis]GGM27467.1 hypothetical protein GCM10009425_42590 [Pseudomonas asuensis]